MYYETITEKELDKMKFNGCTPNFEYQDYDKKTETYTGLIIIKTAQEVYDEWLTNKDKPIEPQPSTDDKIIVLQEKVDVLETENASQNGDISTNTDMIFVALDATTELNESSIANTEMVLISMDALTEINEQLIALQEQIDVLKGVK